MNFLNKVVHWINTAVPISAHTRASFDTTVYVNPIIRASLDSYIRSLFSDVGGVGS